MNLLTTGQSYVNQEKIYTSIILSDNPKEKYKLRKQKEKQKKGHFGYHAMEAIRNHVQHYGWPVHMLSHNLDLDTIAPKLVIGFVEKDKGISSEILLKLKQTGENIDIRPLIVEYMDVISNVHSEIRIMLRPFINEWEQIINNTFDRFEKQFPNIVPGLTLISQDEHVESTIIIKETIEERKILEEKNQASVTTNVKCILANEILNKNSLKGDEITVKAINISRELKRHHNGKI
jgi:hypothetical protein